MHDIKYIREHPEDFDAAMARRGKHAQSQSLLALDTERRELQTKLQELQAERNTESKKIGEIKKSGGDAQDAMDAVARMKNEMAELEERERTLYSSLSQHLAGLPNIMDADVPDGADENENIELRIWGEIKHQSGPEHFEIGEALGMMDFETAAKMSGSRFVILNGALARLERSLAQFFLDTHTGEHGYTEVSPPLLVRDNALFGTGQLPKFSDDLFECFGELRKLQIQYQSTDQTNRQLADQNKVMSEFMNKLGRQMADAQKKGTDTKWLKEFFEEYQGYFIKSANAFTDLSIVFKEYSEKFKKLALQNEGRHWLIPTSEVPLTNMVADSIVEEGALPRRFTAFTPCFRSEAGSAGRDTRGMLRQHQFYKVEMVSVTKPEDSTAEHERMTGCAESVLKALKIPHRTVVLCSGDTGFGARKTFDIEAWLPGQGAYREISSCSNCGDFQARRMNARFKREGEKQTTFLHTLNGSGVAVGRALIAVIENYYDSNDGGVFVPDVLKPYMGGIEKITSA